jgi:hypothetical protein
VYKDEPKAAAADPGKTAQAKEKEQQDESIKKQEPVVMKQEANTQPVNADNKSLVAEQPAEEKSGNGKVKEEKTESLQEKEATVPVVTITEKASGTELDKSPTENTKPTEAGGSYKKSAVTRRSESSTTEGFGLVFIDEYSDGNRDTVSIMIPNPKMAFAETAPAVKTKELVANTVANKKTCPAVAAESDFLKLRKKMAAGKDNEAMLNEAKKMYKTKCITTAQAKNLGNLFLDDAGKYQFFDVSYTHIADPENFPSLETELKEAYFVNRFKALLR